MKVSRQLLGFKEGEEDAGVLLERAGFSWIGMSSGVVAGVAEVAGLLNFCFGRLPLFFFLPAVTELPEWGGVGGMTVDDAGQANRSSGEADCFPNHQVISKCPN